jgi:hypothetical protein
MIDITDLVEELVTAWVTGKFLCSVTYWKLMGSRIETRSMCTS